jgi:hypothetical protein
MLIAGLGSVRHRAARTYSMSDARSAILKTERSQGQATEDGDKGGMTLGERGGNGEMADGASASPGAKSKIRINSMKIANSSRHGGGQRPEVSSLTP